MDYQFFALLSRMKYITRWGLMRNTRPETLSEHCLDAAVLAHALVLLHNRRFGGHADPERAAVLALFHDASEIITGDLPTPVKYFSPEIRGSYRTAERAARDRLLRCLPEDLRGDYEALLDPDAGAADAQELRFVKAADKLSALIKCVEERKMGNAEFAVAEQSLRRALEEMKLPEAQVFLEEFLPAFGLTLDEQSL